MDGIRLRIPARRAFVVLGLFAIGLLLLYAPGCLSDPAPPAPDDDGDGGKDDSTAAPLAFFVLHGSDIRGTDWPEAYVGYRLFVCSPSLSPESIMDVRRMIPGAVLLAYHNTQDIPLGRHEGNPYYNALEAAFDSSLCVTDLATGNVVRQQGATEEPGTEIPHYIVQQSTAEILVAFLRDVTLANDYDGLYLDQSNQSYPPWRRAILEGLTGGFDTNGDGAPESIDAAALQYETWRPYFTTRLREELGPDRVLVANSGGALGDANLNGITLEGVGSRFTPEEAGTFLLAQKAVGRTPFFGVLWGTVPEAEEPSRALAAQIPGTYYGVIDTDG